MLCIQRHADLFASTAQLLLGLLCLTLLTDGREYCWETFNATCDDDEVVLMQSARYGRMKQGRCIKVPRVLDCYNDVMPEMDRLCSGRHFCEMNIPDTELYLKQPCPEDLMPYLEATYSCVKVARRKKPHCRQNERLALSGNSGYISNLITQEDTHGSAKCPWSIQVPKGQKINITLLDFSLSPRFSVDSSICNIYANIREVVSSAPSSNSPVVRVCGGDRRQKSIYLSEGNNVEIEIVTTPSAPAQEERPEGHFLLKYDAVGCPDLVAPVDGWLRRKGEQATVQCNATSETWHLVCDGSQWIGDFKNCSRAVGSEPQSDEDDFPYGLVVAVVIGLILGIVIGVSLLAIVITCNRRYPCGHRRAATRQVPSEVVKGADKARILKSSEYGYAHVWELQQLRAPPEGSVPLGAQKSETAIGQADMFPTFRDYAVHSQRCPYSRQNREHTYECPQMMRPAERHREPATREPALGSPFYHEFDGNDHTGRSQSMTEASTRQDSSEEARYTN